MESNNKSEEALFKEIQGGAYRDYYFIYNRKSTDEPNSQKNSIQYQKAENAKFSHRNKIRIAPVTLKGFCVEGVISEKHSGFKENDDITISADGLVQYSVDRPKFLRLVQFASLGLIRGVVCLCWDRISRNKADDTLIRKLMRKGIDIRFVYATYEKSSSGELHMDIDGMFAEHHSRVTSEKVSIAQRNLRERGVCTYKAPIGYLNEGNMEHKPFDPLRAPIIKKLFELYATGDWSLPDLARLASKEGLTTVPQRRRRTEDEMLAEEDEEVEIAQVSRPITANHVHLMLRNRFYLGKIIGNDGQYVQSISHEALVSEELFAEVQIMLKKKKVSVHYVEKLDLHYRGFVNCALCGRTYTPYPKKGIQYFNARCPDGCGNKKKNINISFLEKEVGKLIQKLSFTEGELIELDARMKTDIGVFEEKRQKVLVNNDRLKKKLREDLTYLRTNKLTLLKTGAYSPEAYLEEEDKLNTELSSLQDAEQVSDIAMHEVIKEIVKLSELLKDGYLWYSIANSAEKEKMTRVIFSELFYAGDTLQYKCKKGFQSLESRFCTVGDPTENRTLI